MRQANIKDRVYSILYKELEVKEDHIQMGSHLMNDLGADSLGSVEIVLCMEDEFDIIIPDEKIDEINYVEDIVRVVGDLLER